MKYDFNKGDYPVVKYSEPKMNGFGLARAAYCENYKLKDVPDSGKIYMYRIFKDGEPCCDNLFFAKEFELENIEKELDNNRFVMLNIVVNITRNHEGTKYVMPTPCVFDTMCCNVIVVLEDHSQYYKVYGNILWDSRNHLVVYLPSMEIIKVFPDFSKVSAETDDFIVVEKVNEPVSFYKVDINTGNVKNMLE